MNDPILERALILLFTKGSDGDGSLHLTAAEAQALCEHVRHLQKPQPVNVIVQIDGRELARHVVTELPNVIRHASGIRNF